MSVIPIPEMIFNFTYICAAYRDARLCWSKSLPEFKNQSQNCSSRTNRIVIITVRLLRVKMITYIYMTSLILQTNALDFLTKQHYSFLPTFTFM